MITLRIQRAFLLFFAAVLFTGSAGIYFYGSLSTALHRRANLKRQVRDEIITLTLSKAAFKSIVWVGEKDFIYEGELYDIESFAASDENYVLKCEKDDCESGIIAAIENQLDTDHGTKTNKTNKPSSFGFECTIPSKVISFRNTAEPLIYADAIAAGPSTAFLHPASPPPEA